MAEDDTVTTDGIAAGRMLWNPTTTIHVGDSTDGDVQSGEVDLRVWHRFFRGARASVADLFRAAVTQHIVNALRGPLDERSDEPGDGDGACSDRSAPGGTLETFGESALSPLPVPHGYGKGEGKLEKSNLERDWRPEDGLLDEEILEPRSCMR